MIVIGQQIGNKQPNKLHKLTKINNQMLFQWKSIFFKYNLLASNQVKFDYLLKYLKQIILINYQAYLQSIIENIIQKIAFNKIIIIISSLNPPDIQNFSYLSLSLTQNFETIGIIQYNIQVQNTLKNSVYFHILNFINIESNNFLLIQLILVINKFKLHIKENQQYKHFDKTSQYDFRNVIVQYNESNSSWITNFITSDSDIFKLNDSELCYSYLSLDIAQLGFIYEFIMWGWLHVFLGRARILSFRYQKLNKKLIYSYLISLFLYIPYMIFYFPDRDINFIGVIGLPCTPILMMYFCFNEITSKRQLKKLKKNI